MCLLVGTQDAMDTTEIGHIQQQQQSNNNASKKHQQQAPGTTGNQNASQIASGKCILHTLSLTENLTPNQIHYHHPTHDRIHTTKKNHLDKLKQKHIYKIPLVFTIY